MINGILNAAAAVWCGDNRLPWPVGDGPPTATSIEESYYPKSRLDLIVGPHGLYAGMILRFGDLDHMAMCQVEGRKPIDEAM